MATEILVRVYLDGSGDYTNVRAAVIAEAMDLVAADSYMVFELKGDLRNTDSFVDFNSYTTDATRNVIIRPIAADYTDGIAGNTGTIYGVNTFLVVSRGEYVTMDGLDFDGWSSDVFEPANTRITNSLMYNGTANIQGIKDLINTICYDLADQSVQSVTGEVTRVTVVNKASVSSNVFLYRSVSGVLTNSVGYNDVVGAANYTLSTNVANDFNASNDGTAPGTNTQTVATTDFEDYANNNFNIKSTSSLFALNVGADLVPASGGIIAKFTRTLPAPTATISGGFVFLLSAGWFTQANTGAAGSPIDGGTNSLANGGGDMKIFSDTAATTQLPIEVVSFVAGGSPVAQVWVRTPSYTAGDTITIGKDDTQTVQPAVGAAFGRNATWVDDVRRKHLEDNPTTSAIDSTGAVSGTVVGSPLSVLSKIGEGFDFNGVNDYVNGGSPSLGTAYTASVWLNLNAGSTNFQGVYTYRSTSSGTPMFFTIDLNTSEVLRFIVRDNAGVGVVLTTALTIVAGVNYKIDLVRDGNSVIGYVDGVAIASGSAAISTIGTCGEIIGAFHNGSPAVVNFIDAVISETGITGAGKSAAHILSDFSSQNDPDNFGTSSEYILVGGGGISVTGDTAAFDFTALAGTVDLTGEILVTGSTASFDYSAISGAIDLTGEIIVTGSTASFDYTGENGVIELGAVINVVGQTAKFDVNGVDADVSVTGEITIVGDTATFDYVARSGIVVIGEGQKIGTVTAGFADSTIGVQYKQNTITVNFGE